MKKNKKIIIVIAVLIVVAIACVLVVLINNQNEKKQIEQANIDEENGVSKLEALSEKLQNDESYSVSLTLNKDNQRTTSRKGSLAKVEIIDEGKKQAYLVKDNTTYLLVDSTKKYYEYENTKTLLKDFENKIDELLNRNYVIGTEEIEGKNYKYEEFENISTFIINYKRTINDSDTKTRLYFDGNDLKYIKTYVGDVEQLLTVEIKHNNQKDSDFEIPEEYKK